MLELTKLPQRFVESLGRDRVAEILEVEPAVLAMWLKKEGLPLKHLETLLRFDPTPLHEIKPLYPETPEGNKLVVLMPYTQGPEPDTMESIMRLNNPKEMAFRRVGFNNLSVARNALAAQWLAGPWTWAFWSDADMVHPCGDADFFRRACGLPNQSEAFAAVHTIHRLLVHQKPFVSVAYTARRNHGGMQFAGGSDPATAMDMRRGPRDKTIERDWCGFGGVLMHRKVLEKIIVEQGKEIDVKDSYVHKTFGYRYAFFSPTNNETPGDDIPFCARAARAGFKPLIDLAVFSGHTGSKTYTYQDL